MIIYGYNEQVLKPIAFPRFGTNHQTKYYNYFYIYGVLGFWGWGWVGLGGGVAGQLASWLAS